MIPNAVRGNSFRGLLDYLFDIKAFSSQGKSEKQPQILNSNMGGQTARELAREFGVVRSLNPKIHKPVWHVSLAFAIGERPPDELLDRIPELFINKVGAQASDGEIGIDSERNQWVAVSHHDKDHFHFHLVVNRINYEGKVCYCKWDKNRSQQACREIEQELGLVQVKGDSSRLFLDGRFVAHLEAEAARTGVVDPRLERYQTERNTRLKEIYEQQSDRAELVRATVGGMSQRDAVGAAGEATGSPDADAAGATTRAAGLAWFQHQCERDFSAALKRVLAAIDRADDPVRDGEPEIEEHDRSSSDMEAKSPEQPETPVVAPLPVLPLPELKPQVSMAQLQHDVDRYTPLLVRLLNHPGMRNERGERVYEDEIFKIVLADRVLSLVQKSDSALLLQAKYQDNRLQALPSQGLTEAYRNVFERWRAKEQLKQSPSTKRPPERGGGR